MGAPRALSGVDLFDWIALRRVLAGGITKLGPWYLDGGRLAPSYLPRALDGLARDGQVTLTSMNGHAVGQQRVTATASGLGRFEELNGWQRAVAS